MLSSNDLEHILGTNKELFRRVDTLASKLIPLAPKRLKLRRLYQAL